MRNASLETSPVTIRPATWADAERLELLAELDEGELPSGPLVLAFVGHELWAAVSRDGAVIADPFRPSADVAALARARARQLMVPGDDRPRPRLWRAVRSSLAPSATS